MTKHQVTSLFAVAVGWRLMLIGVALIAARLLLYQPSFPYHDTLLAASGLPAWVYSWANFDGVHYVTIISKGYIGTGLIQAFFPAYPLTSQAINVLTQQPIVAGLIVSNLAFMAVVFLWWSLVRSWFGSRPAWMSLLAFLCFPTAFFLGAVYSESLFIATILASFLAASRKQWWLAGLCALVASASRVVGVLVVPTLVLMLLENYVPFPQRLKLSAWKKALVQVVAHQKSALAWISLGVIGLLSYMWFLYGEFRDPLYFFHVQAEFGGIRQETLVLYPQVLWRSLRIVLTVKPDSWMYLAYVQELVIGTLGLAAILWSGKKLPLSLVLFSLGVFIVPTLTGTFSSLPRYFLSCVPVFWWLGSVADSRPWVFRLYLVCSTLLLLINTALFIQGYWVA